MRHRTPGLSLDPQACRAALIDAAGNPSDQTHYITALAEAQKEIYFGLAGDPENAYHVRLFSASADIWKQLSSAGAAGTCFRDPRGLGMSDTEAQLAITDVVASLWWSDAMEPTRPR